MKSFTKSRPSSSTASVDVSGLPAGYDDDHSEYYVPIELREIYAASEVVGTPLEGWHAAVTAHARRKAVDTLLAEQKERNEELEPYQRADRQSQATGMRERTQALVDQMLNEQYDALRAELQHRTRMELAIWKLASEQQRIEDDAYARELYTCPVCHVFDPARIGTPDNHTVMLPSGQLIVRCCTACFEIAKAASVDLLAGEVVESQSGRTRRDVVMGAIGL